MGEMARVVEMNEEDVTSERACRTAYLICCEYEMHVQHCFLCIPGQWLCPDAHAMQKSVAYWQERSNQHESPMDMIEVIEP